MSNPQYNIAYVDGQNLYMGTTTSKPYWKVDLFRFRTYLAQKYNISEAYYYLGTVSDDQTAMYNDIQKAGFILVFREHNPAMASIKKGNVDTDIVFDIMKNLYENRTQSKIFLVSADGDYYKLVKFLIDEQKLGKVLFPARRKASSLYRKLEPRFFDALDSPGVKSKIAYKKKPE